jgi:hypothetical protein
MNVTQTVKSFGEAIAARAVDHAAKKLKVGPHDEDAKGPEVGPHGIPWTAAESDGYDKDATDLDDPEGQFAAENPGYADELARDARKRLSHDEHLEKALTLTGQRRQFHRRKARETDPDRHSFSSRDESDEDETLGFFKDQREDQQKQDRERRLRQTEQRRTDPTTTRKYRASPGFSRMVSRLSKFYRDPEAVARDLVDSRERFTSRVIGALERIGAARGSLDRAIDLFDAVADGHYSVSPEVLDRLYADAMEDVKSSYSDPELVEAWGRLLEVARHEAGGVTRHATEGMPIRPVPEDGGHMFEQSALLQEMSGKGKGLPKVDDGRNEDGPSFEVT